MKLVIVAAVLVAVVAVVAAVPQRSGGRAVQSRAEDLTLNVGGKRKKLVDLTEKDIEAFIKTPGALDKLILCFEKPRECRNRATAQFVRLVRNSSGKGRTCSDCDPAEEKRRRKLVSKAVSLVQQEHPKAWRALTPYIAEFI